MEEREFIEQFVLNKVSAKAAIAGYTTTDPGLTVDTIIAIDQAQCVYKELQLTLKARGLIKPQQALLGAK